MSELPGMAAPKKESPKAKDFQIAPPGPDMIEEARRDDIAIRAFIEILRHNLEKGTAFVNVENIGTSSYKMADSMLRARKIKHRASIASTGVQIVDNPTPEPLPEAPLTQEQVSTILAPLQEVS